MGSRKASLAARRARVPWRKAILKEAHERIGYPTKFSKTLMARVDLLESALDFETEARPQAVQAEPFEVADGVLLIIGPRWQARRAARSIFTTAERNPYLDQLFEKPAMVDRFAFEGGGI